MTRFLARFLTGLFIASLFATIFSFNQRVQAEDLPATEAQGSIQQVYGVTLATLNNGVISRAISLGADGPRTVALTNLLTHTQYLKATQQEFRLTLSHELAGLAETIELSSENFRLIGYTWNIQSKDRQQLQVELNGQFNKARLRVSLFYEIQAGTNFLRKWLKVAPFDAPGWVIREAVIEDWQATNQLQPFGVIQRYPELHADSSDQVNYSFGRDLSKVDSSNPTARFTPTAYSREIALHQDGKQGLYFFTESLFGNEHFDGSLQLGNTDFIEPPQGFTSGKAVTGAWQGGPEIGFKRYNEYIYNHYAAIKDKKDPVWFSTWYVYEDKINAENLASTVDFMQAAGFYDVLHVDAGWEKDGPLQINTDDDKFPGGFEPTVDKLKAAGLGLGLWMNPFSGHYEDITSYEPFRQVHPNWIASNGRWICPLSGAGQYIRERMLNIARSWPLQELYWDGADWNLAGCDAKEQGWRTPAEEHVSMLKFYANLMHDLHALRPDLRVVLWSAPPDIHWLSAVDQLQLSDIDDPPIGTSETIRRQQIYHASFQRPAAAIWGDWYGLQYRRHWDDSLGLPLAQLEYAEMSQFGNGATQAGGSYSLDYAPPGLTEFVAKMFAFRKQFAPYFNTYQHVLGFPDGQNVEGEAHLMDGKGFILLYNPGETEQTINLPLNEPELELSAGQLYNLSDWSELSSNYSIGEAHPGDSFSVNVPALGWRVIGINLN